MIIKRALLSGFVIAWLSVVVVFAILVSVVIMVVLSFWGGLFLLCFVLGGWFLLYAARVVIHFTPEETPRGIIKEFIQRLRGKWEYDYQRR